jgi:hypothetical protein
VKKEITLHQKEELPQATNQWVTNLPNQVHLHRVVAGKMFNI